MKKWNFSTSYLRMLLNFINLLFFLRWRCLALAQTIDRKKNSWIQLKSLYYCSMSVQIKLKLLFGNNGRRCIWNGVKLHFLFEFLWIFTSKKGLGLHPISDIPTASYFSFIIFLLSLFVTCFEINIRINRKMQINKIYNFKKSRLLGYFA